MPRQTTPKKISANIKKFLWKAHLTGKPTYLAFHELDPRYKAAHCLDNCRHAARMGTGVAVYGWMIWEAKKESYIEAEFHSVLRMKGRLYDITPRKDGEKRILFVPDPTREPELNGDLWATFTNIQRYGEEPLIESEHSLRGSDRLLNEETELEMATQMKLYD